MKIILENERCFVEISQQAAEVHHYVDKETNIEYEWCGDKQHWANRNPTLFPHIGSLENDQYTYRGQSYHSKQHGFTRYATFEVTNLTKDSATLTLRNNEDIYKEHYPFYFELSITYTLIEKKVTISYTVKNIDEVPLPFEIGMHPAFNVPFDENHSFQEMCLVFEKEENAIAKTRTGVEVALKGKTLHFADNPFQYSKALFFNDLQSNYVDLTDSEHTLRIQIAGMERFGIWKPSPDAPMMCIEPQLPKNTLARNDFFQRGKDNWLLPPGESFQFEYGFEILK